MQSTLLQIPRPWGIPSNPKPLGWRRTPALSPFAGQPYQLEDLGAPRHHAAVLPRAAITLGGPLHLPAGERKAGRRGIPAESAPTAAERRGRVARPESGLGPLGSRDRRGFSPSGKPSSSKGLSTSTCGDAAQNSSAKMRQNSGPPADRRSPAPARKTTP